MSGFSLGQRVRFTRPMKRRTVPVRAIEADPATTTGGTQYLGKRRINKEWQANAFAPEREGIIIGKRTLSNGYTRWEDYGTEYAPAEHFTAYLIVTDLHSKPVHVLSEHITEV